MIAVRQRFSAGLVVDEHGNPVPNPKQTPGDCFRACLASILELRSDHVPHFVAGEYLDRDATDERPARYSGNYIAATNHWLRREGWPLQLQEDYYYIPSAGRSPRLWDRFEALPNPRRLHRGLWIASVRSGSIVDSFHAVVMEWGSVLHDPSPAGQQPSYLFCGELHFVAPDASKCKPRRLSLADAIAEV